MSLFWYILSTYQYIHVCTKFHDFVLLVGIPDEYRDIPVPCQTRYCQYRARYRFFSRYRTRYRVNIGTYPFLAKPDIGFFTDIGPDMVPILQKISEYTDIGSKKLRCRSRCECNIAIYRYRVIPISGVFPDIGDDISPVAPPPPACSTVTGPEGTVQALQPVQPLGPQLCRPKGQCLGYCLHPCAQRATAEKGLGLGWCQLEHHSTRNLKLGIIEFQVATFVTVAADI